MTCAQDPLEVGQVLDVDIGPVAHGGHCVARHEGRVLFVRHALPGERARVQVTGGRAKGRFWRADAIEVLRASADRVQAPCPYARPGGCGGCDFQHVALPAQRALKAQVVREQLSRLGGVEVDVVVEEVDGEGVDAGRGLGWRTRVQFAVAPDGEPGLHAHRSHRVVPVRQCLIAHPKVSALGLTGQRWPGAGQVEGIVSAAGTDAMVLVTALPGRATSRLPVLPPGTSVLVDDGAGPQQVRGRTWLAEPVVLDGEAAALRVSGSGFWQVHPGAPAALVGAVLEQVDPRPGQRVLDLYAGVGLFTAALARRVGEQGEVLLVEADERAIKDARRNLHGRTGVRIEHGRTEHVLAHLLGQRQLGRGARPVNAVVLDPPRSGAGRRVLEQLARLSPAVISYIACDPAALGRDTALLVGLGYRLDALRALDLFPQTHHVECVARFVPIG